MHDPDAAGRLVSVDRAMALLRSLAALGLQRSRARRRQRQAGPDASRVTREGGVDLVAELPAQVGAAPRFDVQAAIECTPTMRPIVGGRLVPLGVCPGLVVPVV